MSKRRPVLALLTAALLASAPAWGQSLDARPVRLVVPNGPGVAPDIIGRLLSARLEKALGVPVVVENKPGASGIIGADAVAKAPADGHTLLYGYNQLVAVNPHLFPKLPYKASDFTPITMLVRSGGLILVNNDSPIRNLHDLIAISKAKPKSLTYGSQGIGTLNHLTMELLTRDAGIEMVHVPFTTNMAQTLMGGQIDVAVEPNGSGVGLVQGGKLRAIATTSAKRLQSLPDVPTVSEIIPGMVLEGWHAIWAPAGLPPAIQARLNKELVAILKLPEFEERMKVLGLEVVASTPEFLDKAVAEENAVWKEIISARGIKLE